MTLTNALLFGIFLGVGVMCALLFQALRGFDRANQLLLTIQQLQLNPRTRISTFGVQSGPVTPEQEGARLGRVSQTRRIVVGGDPDSELNQVMSRAFAGQDDEDE